MWHIVYLTRNLINEKIYIGIHSTWNLDDGYLGSGNRITSAIRKYGIENFERTIIHHCLSREDALAWEHHIVDNSFLSRNDIYNLTPGGSFTSVHTAESKHKISVNNARKGPLSKGQTLEDVYGKEKAAMIKEKISKSSSGRLHTQETKEKLRKPKTIQRGSLSENHKRKISEATSGRTFSEEHKKNIAISAKKRQSSPQAWHSAEVNKKKSEKMKGKKPNNFGKPCSENRKEKLLEYNRNRRLFIAFLALDLLVKSQSHLYQPS